MAALEAFMAALEAVMATELSLCEVWIQSGIRKQSLHGSCSYMCAPRRAWDGENGLLALPSQGRM